ncbi:GntR family transcriptional regulator [bacterium]|nr:MAG: GntR family transcriptional regulator [bacterium]
MSSNPNETSRQKAYTFIQKKLLEGEIRAGDLVSELALAAEIGMSRTPVREAIGQLEIEGLFDKVPRVGTIVRLPDQRELRELYEVREALESHAATIATTVLDDEGMAEMERLHKEVQAISNETQARGLEFLDEPLLHRFFEADIGFHSMIIGATDNRRTLKIINEFRVVQRVYEYGRMTYTLDVIDSAAREHGKVFDALRRGAKDEAREAMAEHIRSSLDHALRGADRRSEVAIAEAMALTDAIVSASKSKRKFRRPLASAQ